MQKSPEVLKEINSRKSEDKQNILCYSTRMINYKSKTNTLLVKMTGILLMYDVYLMFDLTMFMDNGRNKS